MTISKSLYTKGIQCPKALWLKKYKPSILTPSDDSAQAVFDTGNIVGDFACQLFPNGKRVDYSEDYSSMIDNTNDFLIDFIRGYEYGGTWVNDTLYLKNIPLSYNSIYEATFSHEGILVMVDILTIENDEVSIYEVKSSTSLKDIYLHDVSIQYYILKNLGYKIKSANVVYLNSNYIRGDELDIKELFVVEDVTETIKSLQEAVPTNLQIFQTYLADKENEPNIDIGKHCKNPYECDAMHYCWKVQRSIPDYSVFNIFKLGSKNQIELYNQGIVRIEEIPNSYKMTPIQQQKVDNWKAKRTYIDRDSIREFLSTLTYPIYHLDFETFQQAVPQWNGISPYQQIPFQYSLHIEHANGELEHLEFLAPAGADPRYALAQQLIHDIPDNVTVLAYNMSFEKGVIEKLALSFPDLSERLKSVIPNIHDLMIPFQKKWYVAPAMQGSYSIKYVLPAIVPEMEKAYKDLDLVHNGGEAMHAYANMSNLSYEEKMTYRRALLEYCKLDTLAMVNVLKKLKEI